MSTKKTRILIVENDKNMQKLLAGAIDMKLGDSIEIIPALYEREALEKFSGNSDFALIMIDGKIPAPYGNSPEGTTIELVRKFRKWGYQGPILAISNDTFGEQSLQKQIVAAGGPNTYEADKTKISEVADVIKEILKI